MKHSVPDGVPNAAAVLERLKQFWRGYWPGTDPTPIAADVERRLAAAVEDWALAEVAPVGEGNVALVCSATRAGEPVILKLNPRRNPEEGLIAAETAALEFWTPTGAAVRLLDERDGRTTLLLERLAPGHSLDDSKRTWDQKLEILARLVGRLHDAGPPPASIPSLADYADLWRKDLERDPGRVRELDGLLAGGADEVLVHGDLHPGNALRGAQGWTAIDPKAFRGDRHADIWALICPQAPMDRFRERVELYAHAAGLEAERALAWARVRAAAECSGWLSPAAVSRMR